MFKVRFSEENGFILRNIEVENSFRRYSKIVPDFKFCPPLRFLILSIFCHSRVFLQINRSWWYFTCKSPTHTRMNVAIDWCNMLHWFYKIMTWSHKISSRLKRETFFLIIYFEHSGFPPDVTFVLYFYQKTSVVSMYLFICIYVLRCI